MVNWSPLKQWTLAMAILALAVIFHWLGLKNSWAYYTAYVSLLLMAFMNPVINALRANLVRNISTSIVLFAFHALACFIILKGLNGEPAYSPQLFMVILVFYGMATMLSIMFRGIYILLIEGLAHESKESERRKV